jgi:hypothetical protein
MHISNRLYNSIKWTRLIVILSSSFLSLCLGVFLNFTELATLEPINLVSLGVSVIFSILIVYTVVQLAIKSKSFGLKQMKLKQYDMFKILIQDNNRKKVIGRYYFVTNMVF